jgi:hypothetical protein
LQKELIRETEWNRVYRISNTEIRWESKFLDVSFVVSPDSIRKRWHSLSADEQLDFSLAFAAKPVISEDEEEIIEFLLEVADPDVCSNIALLAASLSDKRKALSLLLTRIEQRAPPLANYFQALTLLSERDAVPALEKIYDEYSRQSATADYPTLRDYTHCCRTLLRLTGQYRYEGPLRELSQSRDPRVAALARRLLSGSAG